MTDTHVTLVTGAASGIGRATALRLAERGDRVICADLSATALEEVVSLTGGLAAAGDITVESDADALVGAAVERYGRLDSVVHCAGIEEAFVDARDMSLAVFEQTIRVNVTGSFLVARALAVDWSKFGVRVNVVGPGPVATPMSQASIDDPAKGAWLRERIPLGRPALAQEIAAVCAFLTSDDSSYMTGSYIPVDGGWLAI